MAPPVYSSIQKTYIHPNATSERATIQVDSIDWDEDPILSRSSMDAIRGLANRLLHSNGYKIFYALMAGISLLCFAMTFLQSCPSSVLMTLEYFLCLALLFEVVLRWIVQKKYYWQSVANVFDVIMLLLCVTLIISLHSDCSEMKSLLDSSLLFGRYIVQFIRLLLLVKKHRTSLKSRLGTVDFTDLEMASYRR